MGAVKTVAISIVGLIVVLGGAVGLSASTGTGSNPGCTGGTLDRSQAAAVTDVAGYSGDQLTNAVDIMNAATAAGLDTHAQTLGVMTAMGESSLLNLDHGDVAGPDSRGLFQQRASWGTLADRMNPSTAAGLFFQRLQGVPEWQTLTPTAAASRVQINADPNHYTPYFAPATAVVTALSSSTRDTSCTVSADAVALAQQLVTAADAGQLRGLVPDHIMEIRWIAHGQTVPDCGIDTRILQTMVLAVKHFQTVGVSDINRKCTSQLLGAGEQSSHWINGGGEAVDFYSLGGLPITGADGQSIRLIGLLDPVMPVGARIGQAQCRQAAGRALQLERFTQFDDSCNHLHLDVAFADNGVTVG